MERDWFGFETEEFQEALVKLAFEGDEDVNGKQQQDEGINVSCQGVLGRDAKADESQGVRDEQFDDVLVAAEVKRLPPDPLQKLKGLQHQSGQEESPEHDEGITYRHQVVDKTQMAEEGQGVCEEIFLEDERQGVSGG